MSSTDSGGGSPPRVRSRGVPERTLDVLGDDEARRVLRATGVPKTVSELVEDLGLSQSTAYRKIRALEDVGLIERTNPHARGNTPTKYRRATEGVTVRLGPHLRVEKAAVGD